MKCFASLGVTPKTPVAELTEQIVNVVAAKYRAPTVEGVQDIVEMVLQAAGEYEAAKHYILYRAEHAKMRTRRPCPTHVRDAFAESDPYFPDPAAEVPVLRQIFPLQLRSWPARDVAGNGEPRRPPICASFLKTGWTMKRMSGCARAFCR